MSAQPPTNRDKCCDVVMKGGITSGVVYPLAVVELAKKFRFRNIGGTSAGAIAAAAAAAAEFGEHNGAAKGGFDCLAKLPDLLSHVNTSGRTNLFTFFQPQARTRALYQTLTAGLGKTGAAAFLRVLGAGVLRFPISSLLGVLPGLVVAAAAIAQMRGLAAVFVMLVGVCVAAAGLLVALAWRSWRTVATGMIGAKGNFFGFCTGMSSDPADDSATGPSAHGQALTVWLTKYLNEVAGLDPDGPPLTFGQLWDPAQPAGTLVKPDASAALRLEMFTTCLTHGRPYRLPMEDREEEENIFYFRLDEFERLFPPNVVQWLCQHPRKSCLDPEWIKEGYVPLPEPANLPVIVATRMSLSFPVLLSAIPLHAYDKTELNKRATPETQEPMDRKSDPPERCWFSDGGICSNFPMHLFDSPLPRWPTFGINLVDKENHVPPEELAQPWMPQSHDETIAESWNRFDQGSPAASLLGFIWSIIGTMQNWSDNTLWRMPGFRDRIAHVGVRAREGGLNLEMPEGVIADLTERGRAAGQEFVRRFYEKSTDKMNWVDHRWVRLRSMLASAEELIARIDAACAAPEPDDIPYDAWPDAIRDKEPCFKWKDAAQRQLAVDTLTEIRKLAEKWRQGGISAAEAAPQPRAELRLRPRI